MSTAFKRLKQLISPKTLLKMEQPKLETIFADYPNSKKNQACCEEPNTINQKDT